MAAGKQTIFIRIFIQFQRTKNWTRTCFWSLTIISIETLLVSDFDLLVELLNKSAFFRFRIFWMFSLSLFSFWASGPGIASITEDAVMAPSFGMITVVVATILSELLSSATLCELRLFFPTYSPLGLGSFHSRFFWCCKIILVSMSSSDFEKPLRSPRRDAVESSSVIVLSLKFQRQLK